MVSASKSIFCGARSNIFCVNLICSYSKLTYDKTQIKKDIKKHRESDSSPFDVLENNELAVSSV